MNSISSVLIGNGPMYRIAWIESHTYQNNMSNPLTLHPGDFFRIRSADAKRTSNNAEKCTVGTGHYIK